MLKSQQIIHFIAVGGSAMHNLAIALHNKGYKVTGSDDFIFEPSASRLAKHGLFPEALGWYPERVNSNLDAVILGMHARLDNPELLRAQELGLKIYSYPEYIYEQSKDKIRVVIGGSHGKTTITSMILHVLNKTGKSFDYLVGAQLEGFDTMVQLTDAPIIIIEGDEYLASPIDLRPKFHLYKANLAVLSGIAWDHINVFKTFEDYVLQFSKFIDTIEEGGTLVYSAGDSTLNEVVATSKTELNTIPYYVPEHTVENGITYLEPEHIGLGVFGDHNLLNLQAAKLICEKLGINDSNFNAAISTFKGAAKRLEVVESFPTCTVYKDFAHSPSKLKATISAVKRQFPDRKLIACIELHTFSSLNKEFLQQYKNSMDEADHAIVYIDNHTFEQKKLTPFNQNDVQIAFSDNKLLFFDDVSQLKSHLKSFNFVNSNLLLMSSGTFSNTDLQKLARELNIK